MTPEEAFDRLMRSEPARPFVTYYDEATGERTELSVKSLANWVAKTTALLTDELGLGVGDTALVALPAHWLAYPVLLGCLTAGLALTPDEAGDAAVGFVAPETAGLAAGVPDIFAISTESAAVGFRGAPPDGMSDYVAAVRPQPDAWAGVSRPAGDADPCLAERSRAAMLEAGRDRAAELGLSPGGRLLSTREWLGDAWLDALFVPLAIGGSVVLVRNASDDDVLARRAEQERVDVVR